MRAGEAETPPASVAYVEFSGFVNVRAASDLMAHMTDIAAKGIPRVVMSITTPGGVSEPGFDLYERLRALPFHLVTHAVQIVESIGVAVYLAGDERRVGPMAKIMLHEGQLMVQTQGPATIPLSEVRRKLVGLEAEDDRERAIIVDRTPMTEQEARDLVEGGAELGAQEAVDVGIAHEIMMYEVDPPNAPRYEVVVEDLAPFQ
jgi:ATP-dependent Clp protease, protease subunit